METIKWGAGFLSNFRTSCRSDFHCCKVWIGSKEKFSCFLQEKWRVKNAVQQPPCGFSASEEKQSLSSCYPITCIFVSFSYYSQNIPGSCFPPGADEANWISGWMKQKRKESGWGCKILTNIRSFWISTSECFHSQMWGNWRIFQYTIKWGEMCIFSGFLLRLWSLAWR